MIIAESKQSSHSCTADDRRIATTAIAMHWTQRSPWAKPDAAASASP